jgi:hypothetical protein
MKFSQYSRRLNSSLLRCKATKTAPLQPLACRVKLRLSNYLNTISPDTMDNQNNEQGPLNIAEMARKALLTIYLMIRSWFVGVAVQNALRKWHWNNTDTCRNLRVMIFLVAPQLQAAQVGVLLVNAGAVGAVIPDPHTECVSPQNDVFCNGSSPFLSVVQGRLMTIFVWQTR